MLRRHHLRGRRLLVLGLRRGKGRNDRMRELSGGNLLVRWRNRLHQLRRGHLPAQHWRHFLFDLCHGHVPFYDR